MTERKLFRISGSCAVRVTSEFAMVAKEAMIHGDGELIRLCIKKWTFVRDMVAELGCVVDPGGQRTCALCLFYFNDHCEKCPIYVHTGERYCLGTPNEYYETGMLLRMSRDKALRLIDKELAFLKMVLECDTVEKGR